jgi:hypothetical protein
MTGMCDAALSIAGSSPSYRGCAAARGLIAVPGQVAIRATATVGAA